MSLSYLMLVEKFLVYVLDVEILYSFNEMVISNNFIIAANWIEIFWAFSKCWL